MPRNRSARLAFPIRAGTVASPAQAQSVQARNSGRALLWEGPARLPLYPDMRTWRVGRRWSPGSSEKCGTWKGPRCRAWCVKPRRHRGPDLRENRRGSCTHSVDGQTERCPGSAGKNFASFFFSLSLGPHL